MVTRAIATGPRQPAREETSGSLAALRSLLGVPGFLRLVAGNGIALSGHKLQSIAIAWLVLESTGSRLSLGIVIGAPAIAVVGASLLGGVLADSPKARLALRYTRLAMAASAAGAGVLVTSGNPQIAFLMLASLVTAFSTAVDMPVSRTIVFDVVGRDRALSGVAMNSMATNLSAVIGPLAVGALIQELDAGIALYAIGAAYAASAFLVPNTQRPDVPATATPFQDLRDGFAYLRQTPCVAWLVGLFFLVPVAGLFFAMIPIYAHEVLDIGASGLGLLMAAYGAGTVTSSGYLVVRSRVRRRGFVVSLSGVLFGVAVALFALSGTLLVAGLIAFVLGVLAMVWQNTLAASLQTAASPEMKGRAMSVATMGIQLMTVGWLAAGILATLVGPHATVIAGGVAFAALSLFAFLRSPELRAID